MATSVTAQYRLDDRKERQEGHFGCDDPDEMVKKMRRRREELIKMNGGGTRVGPVWLIR